MNLKHLISIPALSIACHAAAQDAPKPNILWLVSEDNNVTWVGCYGNKDAKTPTIDKLAKDGFQYMNAFASAPVCAPSRSTWITGLNAISMGTHNMRSRYKIPHDKIKYYPDYLREAGYYCCNFKKTDYNIGGRSDFECWDNAKTLDWNALKKHQPFFQVINCGASHESQAKHHLDNTRHKPENVKLFKYHPDLEIIRKNYARYYDCMENMDSFFGRQLKDLKKAGLADDTIVIYNSDHGGVLPRSKRFLFDSGIHAPLVIYIPPKFKNLWPADKTGSKIYRLVSFLDMPKTWISLAGGKVPAKMQGRIFLGADMEPEGKYHFAFRCRMDEAIDNQRAVRDKRFLYIKNYMPYVPWGQKLEYMWEMPAYKAWDEDFKAGHTDAVRSRFFTLKNRDELYDTQNDPDNINNLIDNPEYKEVVKEMRASLRSWQEKIYDTGLMLECEIVKRAKDNNITIYELARNPKLYNLDAYLELADAALEKNPDNLKTFRNALDSDDSAIRYWGLIGALLIPEQLPKDVMGKIATLLKDPSYAVRATAAMVMIKKNYQKVEALECLQTLLKRRSYAILYIVNLLRWIGDDAKSLMPALLAYKSHDLNIQKIQRDLFDKFGVPLPERLKQVKHKKKK